MTLENFMVLGAAIFYALALSYITIEEDREHGNLKKVVDLVLATACITSISFMSTVFCIKNWFENMCYFLMVVIVIGVSLIKKGKK